jgi:hypothetical protein
LRHGDTLTHQQGKQHQGKRARQTTEEPQSVIHVRISTVREELQKQVKCEAERERALTL